MGKILVVEDEENVNRGISFSLEKEGHAVCSCTGIFEAKARAAQFHPEIVICDINLPDGNGLDFIRWLRARQDAYIICLTALDQELDYVMGYEAGADDYMAKPFSLSVLLLKIEAHMRRSAKEDGDGVLYSGALCINPKEMTVAAAGVPVGLTKNEWKLFNCFLQNPKQILSKEQLLAKVFDANGAFVDENTLAVNIRRLREKLEKNPAAPVYIKNVRGLGYIWNVEVTAWADR